MLNTINQDEFNALAAQGYNRIPLVLETFADLDTPLSLYLKLANQPFSYLLESVQGGERFGRYSIIGLPAKTRIVAYGRKVQVLEGNAVVESVEDANPLDFVKSYQSRFKTPPYEGLPRFTGGLAGYFGYETVRYIEKRLADKVKPDAINVPDVLLMVSEQLAVVDNLSGKLYFIVYADSAEPSAYEQAKQRLSELVQKLRNTVTIPKSIATDKTEATSEFGEDNFKTAVKRAQQYILDGDIMQVVLSQRMSQQFSAPPLSLYRALRSLNPSPYMFYYDMGDHHVVGASPEILVRLENGTVTARPIAGTRPRGKTREQDIALAEELLADPKERAEHVQLMDLGRNDVGRVAVTGSVKVTDNMMIERYSHVMHIVSNVEGKLKPGMDAIDVIKATFPAGTVSGAPKVRAMEIIDELEPSKRGIYAGAVGYLGFNGDMDVAIAIRTGVIKNNMLYVQAGAGIVADSVPESEWMETQNKARAVLRAAELVQDGLDVS
ncbi:anthranilate synthase component I [Methylotenera mobilis]|jgi:anthranilate synthase component 1|uniref:Anthranilate synthase component 1 n=1 Tax=Methylotenera mobilis TaxID=359408 RepID=A0A351R9C5_9PROT|nr:anthranilate synthase component I [Methylotenera mobilis]PPC97635.1 MAG: anthranilate synthase component I [Methylotenera sp.]HBA08646.1 anthranilate synthase component I [Methylotenera mobilis]